MKSYKTTILGAVCLLLAAHSASVLYQAGAHLLFQWDGTIALTATGLGLLVARDHSHKDKP